MNLWKVKRPKDYKYNGGASIGDHVKMTANEMKSDKERDEAILRRLMETGE